MSQSDRACAICELIRYYLAHWKCDMKCSICGRIWKIPISAKKSEESKMDPEIIPESLSKTSRKRHLSLRESDRKRIDAVFLVGQNLFFRCIFFEEIL